jgi:hypothetical protein
LMILLSVINIMLNINKHTTDNIRIMSGVSSIVLTVIVFSNARLFAGSTHYLMPIYPYYIISAISAIIMLRDITGFMNKASTVIIVIVFGHILTTYGWIDIRAGLQRLNYEHNSEYIIYQYINKRIPNGARLAVSHSVIISPEKDFIIFHWWRNDVSKLEEFDPDYMIYLYRFGVNKRPAPETIAFNSFAKRMGYQQIKRIGRFVVLERPRPR